MVRWKDVIIRELEWSFGEDAHDSIFVMQRSGLQMLFTSGSYKYFLVCCMKAPS